MKGKSMLISVGIAAALPVLGVGAAISAQDKNSLKVPNGLAFSEFRGYEGWRTISISNNGGLLAVILGNPAIIDAYKAGQPLVPDTLHDIDFMVKDSKRFADSGGWGYAEFEYDAASTIVKMQDYVFTEYPKR
jgi:hypothetical protein